MTESNAMEFDQGPDGLEVAQTSERLILRKRTYRSLDWAFIMLCIPVTIAVFILFGIGVVEGTLFNFSWWGESLVYVATFAWFWFSLTRVFNRRTVTVTADQIQASDGPIWSSGGAFKVPLCDIEEVETLGSKHLTSDLTTYRWYRVYARKRDGLRLPIFKKLQSDQAAKFVKAKIDQFRRNVAS